MDQFYSYICMYMMYTMYMHYGRILMSFNYESMKPSKAAPACICMHLTAQCRAISLGITLQTQALH